MGLPEVARALSALPGIGQRTAQRLALSLAERPVADRKRFLADLGSLPSLAACRVCGFVAAGGCPLCDDEGRDPRRIAVVATAADVLVLEATDAFPGVSYHCLGGLVAPNRGKGPEDLSLEALKKRVEGGVEEVVLAFGAGIEADLTAAAIREALPPGTPLSRLAVGLPVGADLAHADLLTIRRSLEERRPLE